MGVSIIDAQRDSMSAPLVHVLALTLTDPLLAVILNVIRSTTQGQVRLPTPALANPAALPC